MEILLVLLIVLAEVYLFVTGRFRADFVALLVLGVLVLVGLLERVLPGTHHDKWITLEEHVSGFSNPATITVSAMFVLSAGLQRTGALAWVAQLLGRLRPVSVSGSDLIGTWPANQIRGLRVAARSFSNQSKAASGMSWLRMELDFPL